MIFKKKKNTKRIRQCRERLENCASVLETSKKRISEALKAFETDENCEVIAPIKTLVDNLVRLEDYVEAVLKEIKGIESNKDIEKIEKEKIDQIVNQADEMSVTALQAVSNSLKAFNPDNSD
ncbi:MAG: hypothetical protein JXK07_13840 [Spirochaetes bacterium]|nr:hypothetical protein [Spirochaetota bacterium]MBN2771813.1 hypothetical protein [Spirochaetota bacterium]